jgi:aryl-alcohol dehydrogenase-like predicted oxidoreductase
MTCVTRDNRLTSHYAGRFQTVKQMEEKKQNNEGIRSMMAGPEQTENEKKISAALDKVAQKHGIESPTAVALAYVMAKAPYVFPIVGG